MLSAIISPVKPVLSDKEFSAYLQSRDLLLSTWRYFSLQLWRIQRSSDLLGLVSKIIPGTLEFDSQVKLEINWQNNLEMIQLENRIDIALAGRSKQRDLTKTMGKLLTFLFLIARSAHQLPTTTSRHLEVDALWSVCQRGKTALHFNTDLSWDYFASVNIHTVKYEPLFFPIILHIIVETLSAFTILHNYSRNIIELKLETVRKLCMKFTRWTLRCLATAPCYIMIIPVIKSIVFSFSTNKIIVNDSKIQRKRLFCIYFKSRVTIFKHIFLRLQESKWQSFSAHQKENYMQIPKLT